eukprot:scaffold29781_cov90-Isochrysis_galbana.AAC.3
MEEEKSRERAPNHHYGGKAHPPDGDGKKNERSIMERTSDRNRKVAGGGRAAGRQAGVEMP